LHFCLLGWSNRSKKYWFINQKRFIF
jgi:hypothetical protein